MDVIIQIKSIGVPVCFKGIWLCELGVADVALVRFLARVDAQVALQLEGIWAGVRAMGALEWSLSGVAPELQS